MADVQIEHRLMFAGSHLLSFRVIDDSEGSPYLYAVMRLDTSVQEVQAMNRKLVRLIVEKLGSFPSGLVMAFRKAHQREQMPVAA